MFRVQRVQLLDDTIVAWDNEIRLGCEDGAAERAERLGAAVSIELSDTRDEGQRMPGGTERRHADAVTHEGHRETSRQGEPRARSDEHYRFWIDGQRSIALSYRKIVPTIASRGGDGKGNLTGGVPMRESGDFSERVAEGLVAEGLVAEFLVFVLKLVELVVEAVEGEELLVGALLAEMALVHDEDDVGALDGG